MKKFIFYTTEGYTESPTGKTVENFQVLGFEYGENIIKAQKTLINKNQWIVELGFNENKIVGRQIIS
jgi:hypothetical protein